MLERIKKSYPEDEFLIADGYDHAVIGVEEKTLRLIYSVREVIETLKIEMGEPEAWDFFYFNIEGAYIGPKTPIWCYDTV